MPLFAILCLPACAGREGDYPSLAPRPIERNAHANRVDEPLPQPEPADAALKARIATLIGMATESERDFAQAYGAAERAVAAARGAAQSSEPWIAAVQLVSALAIIRGDARDALQQLDSLVFDLSNPAPGVKTVPGIVEARNARETVAALCARQDAMLAKLHASLD